MKSIENEILKIHKMFQSWYQGTLEPSDLEIEIGSCLADDFYIVTPDATKQTKRELLEMMKNDHGNDANYVIEIKNIEIRSLSDACYLASYQEWQYWYGNSEPNLKIQTSSVLRKTDDLIKWEVIHETEIKDVILQ